MSRRCTATSALTLVRRQRACCLTAASAFPKLLPKRTYSLARHNSDSDRWPVSRSNRPATWQTVSRRPHRTWARPWGEGLWRGGVALVLGNEAHGLSDDVAAQIDAWARLPIVGKAESLNVAVAGGVLMYAWLRENYPVISV